MIEIYEGRLGGGKTYSAVKKIVQYLSSGGVVRTNVELNVFAIKKVLREKFFWELEDKQLNVLTDVQIRSFHKYVSPGSSECPNLVVIDEAQLFFNSRAWASTDAELLCFLTQSRKQFTDVIFITQNRKLIDKQFRLLVQYVWEFKDIRKVSIPLPIILGIQRDYSDDSFVLSRTVSWISYWVYGCYNTFQLVRTFERAEANNVKNRNKKILKAVLMGYLQNSLILIFIFLLLFNFYTRGSI